MADNEISLKCRICGGTFFIAKRFGLEGYYRNSKLDGDDLLKFIDDHHYSCAVTPDHADDDIFDVEYEVAPPWLDENRTKNVDPVTVEELRFENERLKAAISRKNAALQSVARFLTGLGLDFDVYAKYAEESSCD